MSAPAGRRGIIQVPHHGDRDTNVTGSPSAGERHKSGTRRAWSRRGAALAALVLLPIAGGLRTAPDAAAKPVAAATGGWVSVDYGALVDRRRLSHSGESVGFLLQRLAGRPFPPPGERPEDAVAHILLDPILEPYAFVLPDALDAIAPSGLPRMEEVGFLWQPGEAQPAWAELLRARHFVVESDGSGRFRVCLPFAPAREEHAPSGSTAPSESPAPLPRTESEAAGKEAWEDAWPVLRHVFAAEKRRLARASGGRPEDRALDVEVHAYVADPARTRFHLGLGPYRVKVEDTRGYVPGVDLQSWQSFLDRGLRLEGGRLGADGAVRLLGSETASRPTLLGRPLSLSDFAIAYRAVFRGGVGEPYMSLDRGGSPQTSLVNYGGRLQDTSLGLVSLQCDIRFKTFSQGIDILANQDLRERIRRELPEFRTHQERFAADARSRGVLTQQTRLWFYPDSVDLTLSPQSDVLVLRRVRMSAASERVQQQTFTAGREPDPPWTADTVGAINKDYDALARFFTEMADLDEVVRLLSLFSWLRRAEADGAPVPDLDVLLALEVPAQPTPRTFPQLLAFNAVPPSGGSGAVEVFSRVSVGEALDDLQPRTGAPLPAERRFRRALAALDRRQADHAALAKELETYDPARLDESALDLLAYRAERLRMHQIVLNTLSADQRAAVDRRKQEVAGLREISVGIGGLDLGMGQAVDRASRRNEGLRFEGESPGGREAPTGQDQAVRSEAAGGARDASSRRGAARTPPGESAARPADPALLPPLELPEHGPSAGRAAPGSGTKPGARDAAGSRASRIWEGSSETEPRGASWVQTLAGADGPYPHGRRVIEGLQGDALVFERLEGLQFVRYRLERESSSLSARPVERGLPEATAGRAADPRGLVTAIGDAASAESAGVPGGLVTLQVRNGRADSDGGESPGSAAAGAGEPATVALQIRGGGGREMTASFPRAVLQRLVLGKGADLAPDRPLGGLSPAEKVLGDARHLMVVLGREQVLPPWYGPAAPLAGEEDPIRLASALERWWSAGEAAQGRIGVVVGTDPRRSPERWEKVSGVGAKLVLLLPEDAFPGPAASTRAKLAAALKAGEVRTSLASGSMPSMIVLVSAEDPALFGARLRELARDPALEGRLLAAWSLGGPVRQDLPASLLAEGRLAALGLAEFSPLAIGRSEEALRAYSSALQDSAARQRRPEDVPGPFLWYY